MNDAEDLTGEEGTVLRSLNHAIWITGIDYSDPENSMIGIHCSQRELKYQASERDGTVR